ncbi:MAG: DUF4328 domain-containing protein [Bacteroidetes bacterium]|nr:DUF4328 domain-containing protein [Bacteroidota bacterium]
MDQQVLDEQMFSGNLITDNSGRRRVISVLFYLQLGISILALPVNYFRTQLVYAVLDGEYYVPPLISVESLEVIGVIFFLVNLLLFIVTGVYFLAWMHRMYANVHRLNIPYLKYGQSWAVLGWLLPFASFVIPLQILSESWDEMQDFIRRQGRTKTRFSKSSLLIWWMLFSAFFLMVIFVLVLAASNNSFTDIRDLGQFFLISGLVKLLATLSAVVFFRQFSDLEMAFRRIYAKSFTSDSEM